MNSAILQFEQLPSWRAAREVMNDVYRYSGTVTFSRDAGLCDQLRTVSWSVMSCLAKAFEAPSRRESRRQYSNVPGICGELKSKLYTALDQDYISRAEFIEVSKKIDRVQQLVQRQPLRRRVQRDRAGTSIFRMPFLRRVAVL